MSRELAVVVDCGSTNISVSVIDAHGDVVAVASRPNRAHPQPGGEGWRVWDLEEIWGKACECCREVCSEVDGEDIRTVTVCTFGADGAPLNPDGSLAYPPICWQDARTEGMAGDFGRYMDPLEAYLETGYPPIRFNTLLRWIWLRENEPEVLEGTQWLMMPGLISFLLSGECSVDPTSAGTTMAVDMACRRWSERMLKLAGLSEDFFPPWAEPGKIVGRVTRKASEATGLPEGTPVVAAGHDTQFAAVGSGAGPEEMILSSGTWEILMLRTDKFSPSGSSYEDGVLYELDAQPGLWNPQLLMMGSAVLEWVRRRFYGGDVGYDAMIEEAKGIGPGSDGLLLLPSFVPETGPTRRHGTRGTVLGLSLDVDRGHFYRAALEGLSFQLRHALEVLERATGFRAEGVRVVGGGSKNSLWNRIRADVLGLPVSTLLQEEATTLGAAIFAFLGAGVFSSVEEAREAMLRPGPVYEPSEDRETYEELYRKYREVPEVLEGVYRGWTQC
ncbi:MAG: L-fuculokinase [Candidatus Latescibacterota bacterium]|nr:MAG: L-fuculokinase [Candidatus Latescibacterota bacterium]